jgi:hypothetical protein
MSWARAVLRFFGIHMPPDHIEPLKAGFKPRTVFTPVGDTHTGMEDTAEVDNIRERYSAARYVEALKTGMNGDYTGRAEWQRHLLTLKQDDVRLFFYEVDQLVEAGALVHVLTEEETAQVKQRVLNKVEEYREKAKGRPLPIDPALMNSMLSGTHASSAGQGAFPLEPYPEGADEASLRALQEMDESEVAVWLEDIEEGDTNEDHEESAREGQSEDDQGQEVEERERLLN